MFVFAVSFMFTTFAVPSVAVSHTSAVPPVIVLEAPTLSVPVTVVVAPAFPAGSDPRCAAIRWVSPITSMPNVATLDGIPVAVNPNIPGARSHRPHTIHSRRRRSADPNSDGYLSFKGG